MPDPASTAPSFSTSKAQDLAQLYRDRLIERLSQEELDNLVNLPPRTRESRIAGWVTDMMREDGSILRSDLLSDIIDVVQNEMVGLGPLQPLLRDPSITEIMVNWVRRSEHDPDGLFPHLYRAGRRHSPCAAGDSFQRSGPPAPHHRPHRFAPGTAH